MSANTSSPPVAITDAETWALNTIFYMIGGVTGLVTNFIVLLIIIRDKKLRASSFFVELCIVSLNRCTGSGQCFVISIYRFLKLLGWAPMIVDRWTCYSLFLVLMHFSQVDFSFLTFMAIDRIIAIAIPMTYKSVTPKIVSVVFGIVFVGIVCGLQLPEFFASMPSRIACVNVISPMLPTIYYAGTVQALILSFFITLSYIALVAFVLIKYIWRKKNANQAQLEVTMKNHLDILRPLMIMVASTVICSIIPRFLFFFASFSSAPSARLVAYGGALSNVDFNVMCWALLAKSSDFRTAFKKRFMNKVQTTQVVPLTHGKSAASKC